eukprot:TRINITY_DN6585_c0_g5_i1.p1 TRINITY_DN6585_c0_g5~~TRINITY_DN6585_c0_g5_i1.p1  ORF type:complete len:112 (-),score=11.52 TRINITY_DN6585_c0_g5_i1:73-408(-)
MEFCKENVKEPEMSAKRYKPLFKSSTNSRVKQSYANKKYTSDRKPYALVDKTRNVCIEDGSSLTGGLIYPTAKSQEQFSSCSTQCRAIVKVKGKEPRQRRRREDRKVPSNI